MRAEKRGRGQPTALRHLAANAIKTTNVSMRTYRCKTAHGNRSRRRRVGALALVAKNGTLQVQIRTSAATSDSLLLANLDKVALDGLEFRVFESDDRNNQIQTT